MFPVVSCTIAAMKAEDRKRLGRAVVDRRTELGMRTTKALAERADLSPRMLGDVENGRRDNFSAGAKAQIERALRWDSGSIDRVLSGKEPLESGVIRGRTGKPIERWTGFAGSNQTELEVYRLAHLVMDIRDLVRAQTGPLATALSSLLDEASDLAVRRVAQWRSGLGDEAPDAKDLEDALWFVGETRGTNAIRREGAMYVTDNDVESLWGKSLTPLSDVVRDGDVPPPTELAAAARTGDSLGQAMRDKQDREAEQEDALNGGNGHDPSGSGR